MMAAPYVILCRNSDSVPIYTREASNLRPCQLTLSRVRTNERNGSIAANGPPDAPGAQDFGLALRAERRSGSARNTPTIRAFDEFGLSGPASVRRFNPAAATSG